jgi:hypothetical protein
MNRFLFRAAFVFLPWFAASLLQIVWFGPLGRLENLPWGLTFGFGWFLAGETFGYTRPVDFFGFLAWPLFVCVLLYRLSGIIWRNLGETRWQSVLFVFALSLFVVAPFHDETRAWYDHLPLFVKILDRVFD